VASALLLPAGELARIFRLAARQADQLEQLRYAIPDVATRHPPIHQAVADVLRHREIRKQRVGLEDDAVVAARRRQSRDVAAVLHDAPGALRFEAGDDAQQRGLAAARRAEQADELALVDREADVAKRDEAAEVLGNPLDR
jgi:hypothetical protein